MMAAMAATTTRCRWISAVVSGFGIRIEQRKVESGRPAWCGVGAPSSGHLHAQDVDGLASQPEIDVVVNVLTNCDWLGLSFVTMIVPRGKIQIHIDA